MRYHSTMIGRLATVVLAFGILCLPACESGGHFTLFGYTTRPNYDPCIKTVYVPIFENKTLWRGMEVDLTRAVITAIEANTPFKVVSDRANADTELCGTIIAFNKQLLNRNQLNEIREAETVLTVGIVWRDLRSGEILSQPKQGTGPAPPPFMQLPDLAPGAGSAPANPLAPAGTPAIVAAPPAVPVLVTSTATYIPEIGQSTTTSQQLNCKRLATQIVSLMEKPW